MSKLAHVNHLAGHEVPAVHIPSFQPAIREFSYNLDESELSHLLLEQERQFDQNYERMLEGPEEEDLTDPNPGKIYNGISRPVPEKKTPIGKLDSERTRKKILRIPDLSKSRRIKIDGKTEIYTKPGQTDQEAIAHYNAMYRR